MPKRLEIVIYKLISKGFCLMWFYRSFHFDNRLMFNFTQHCSNGGGCDKKRKGCPKGVFFLLLLLSKDRMWEISAGQHLWDLAFFLLVSSSGKFYCPYSSPSTQASQTPQLYACTYCTDFGVLCTFCICLIGHRILA